MNTSEKLRLDTRARRAFARTPETCRYLLGSSQVRRALWSTLLREISYTHGLLRHLGRPQVFEIETTNRCPYTCIMCPRTHAMTRATGDMDIGLFRAIIDQMRPAWQMESIRGRPRVRLVHYGEPFVYRHFVESIVHCHRRGFVVNLSSNPSMWTDRRIAESVETGIDEIVAMVDGLDDKTSTAIRGKRAGFARSAENIRKMAGLKIRHGSNKPHLTVAMVKQPRNRHQWARFKHTWEDIEGVDAAYLGHYSTFDGSVEALNDASTALGAADPAQAAQLDHQAYLSQYPCFYPWHSVSVTWQGEVVPCCRDYDARLVLGDLNRRSLLEVWNAAPMQRLRRKFMQGKWDDALCATCREASLEIGLPGRYYPVARLMRRWGWGRMHLARQRQPSKPKPVYGAQNISGEGFRRPPTAPKKRHEEEPRASARAAPPSPVVHQ